jgi:ParB family chromosome partitioning protein
MENRALGKGLSALIPERSDLKKTDLKNDETVATLNIDSIRLNTLQPRKRYDNEKLSELIASIKERGVLQPILVRKKDNGFEVVAGERRLRAARALNMAEVPVIIRDVSDKEALILALIENIQREELNAIEEAQAFKRLIEDFSLTQEDVAKSVGKNRSTVSNVLRLLRLPDEIRSAIEDGALSEGHARALLSVENLRDQLKFFRHAVEKGISVREMEDMVREGTLPGTRPAKRLSAAKDFNIIAVEEGLRKVLGTKVMIKAQKKRGKIIIEYYSNDDLDRIVGVISK